MRFKFTLVFLVITLLACRKVSNSDAQLISHAGGGLSISSAPFASNSKKAIDYALAFDNCNGVELDLQLSKDGELWLFHDQFLKEKTGESGCVNTKISNTLKGYNYQTLNKEKLLALSDLDISNYPNKTFYFDLKHYDFCSQSIIDTSVYMNELVAKVPTAKVITNYIDWIKGLKEKGFTIYFALQSENLTAVGVDFNLIAGVIIKRKDLDKVDINYFRNLNLEIGVDGNRSPKDIEQTLKSKPDFILTDNIKAAINIKN